MQPQNLNPITDDDDDDEIILVSSTGERWEKLHGIERKYRNGKETVKTGTADDENDDILVVALTPTPTRSTVTVSIYFWMTRGVFQAQHVVAGIVFLIWMFRRRSPTRKIEATVEAKVETNTVTNATPSTSTAVVPKENETRTRKRTRVENSSTHDEKNEDLSQSSPTYDVEGTCSIQCRTENETRQVAQQYVQGYKVVEQVVKEQGIDPSLAPQIAMSIQSTQRIIANQTQNSYNTAILNAQQHKESLRNGSNWEKELQETRDQSYYWNPSNGGISRLWWEVFAIQQLALRAVPIWQRYIYYKRDDNEMGLAFASILKETLASMLAQVCECKSPGSALQFPIRGTESISSLPFFLTSTLNRVLQTPTLQFWTCYGHCAILTFTLLLFTVLCHKALHMLSVPPLLHHVVNLFAMALFFGPQHMLGWVFAPFIGVGSEVAEETTNATRVGCSVVLLSLWVLLPLWNWKTTSSLYGNAERNIRADQVNFKATFRTEKSQLEQKYREQMRMRYLALSVYAALVVWENMNTTSYY